MQDIRLRMGNKSVSLVAMYATLISVCYILPVIKYSVPYVLLGPGLLLTYVFAVIGMRMDRQVVFPTVVCSLGLGIMMLLVTNRGNITAGVNEIIAILRYGAPGILYLTIYKNLQKNKKQMWLLFIVLSAVLFIICHSTITELDENPLVARMLAAGSRDEEIMEYRLRNIGGYAFSYAFGFVSLFLAYLAVEPGRTWRTRLLAITGYIYSLYYIVRVQYMTLLVLTVLGSVVLLYISRETKTGKRIVFILVIVLVFMVPDILDFLAGLEADDSNQMLLSKFMQMSEATDEGMGALGVRPELYKAGLQHFLDSPIWGNRCMDGYSVLPGYGNSHSTLIGYLEAAGIIGAVCFYCLFAVQARTIFHTVKNCSKFAAVMWICMIIMYILHSILNAVQYCYEMSFILFLYIPCGMQLFAVQTGRVESNGNKSTLEN